MKKYVCRHCGFDSLIDPGERCPGCGYLFSYLNSRTPWTKSTMEAEKEETAIRRLTCALMRQDEERDGMLMDCLITSRSLRLRPCGYYRDGKAKCWLRGEQSPFEIVLPYRRLTKITQGTHRGESARFYTYHHQMIGPLNLWFFVDRGVAAHCGDIDREAMETVSAFLKTNENRCSGAASVEKGEVRT